MKKVIDSPEHQKLQELALTPYYLEPAAYAKLWIETEIGIKPILENLQPK